MRKTLRDILIGSVETLEVTAESPTSKVILVVGTFRSGTNLLKWLLQEHYRVKVVFSKWFWKHGVPPTRMFARTHLSPPVPIIVLSKDPVAHNLSLYRFWKARRPELDVGRNISEFVRKELIVYDSSYGARAPHYLFNTPTDYWNQFNYAYLNWPDISGRVHFVRYDELAAETESALATIADRYKLRRRSSGRIVLPDHEIMPSPDRGLMTTGEPVAQGREMLPEDDVKFILSRAHAGVAAALGYPL